MSELNLPILNNKRETTGQVEIPKALATLVVKPALVHQVIVSHMANARAGTAHTKTRDEVRGGGRKPWKQKGTGRARQGSIRSPQWIGGGVVHGPRNERNYTQRTPEKLKALAKGMVVKDYLERGLINVVAAWPETTKTKDMMTFVKNVLPNAKKLKALVLLTETEKTTRRALKNIPGLEIMSVKSINAYDGLCYPKWLMSEAAVKEVLKLTAAKLK